MFAILYALGMFVPSAQLRPQCDDASASRWRKWAIKARINLMIASEITNDDANDI